MFGDIRCVLFDFDGTLVDASSVIVRSFSETLEARGFAPFPEGALRDMIGRPLREMFFAALPEGVNEGEVDRCIAEYRRRFRPLALPLSRPLPGAGETLTALSEGGRTLAVVTTRASDDAYLILEGFGLRGRIETIVGLEHVRRLKPDPEPVLLALDLLGARAEQTLMVGDTPDDIAAGRGAGVGTVGVTTGPYDGRALRAAGADLVIDELSQVLEALDVDRG